MTDFDAMRREGRIKTFAESYGAKDEAGDVHAPAAPLSTVHDEIYGDQHEPEPDDQYTRRLDGYWIMATSPRGLDEIERQYRTVFQPMGLRPDGRKTWRTRVLDRVGRMLGLHFRMGGQPYGRVYSQARNTAWTAGKSRLVGYWSVENAEVQDGLVVSIPNTATGPLSKL